MKDSVILYNEIYNKTHGHHGGHRSARADDEGGGAAERKCREHGASCKVKRW